MTDWGLNNRRWKHKKDKNENDWATHIIRWEEEKKIEEKKKQHQDRREKVKRKKKKRRSIQRYKKERSYQKVKIISTKKTWIYHQLNKKKRKNGKRTNLFILIVFVFKKPVHFRKVQIPEFVDSSAQLQQSDRLGQATITLCISKLAKKNNTRWFHFVQKIVLIYSPPLPTT